MLRNPTYHDDVSIAANLADWADGASGDGLLFLLFFLTLVLFLCGFVALVGTGVALCFLGVGHHVDQALEWRAQFPLLVFFQAIVQSFVDHDTQWVDNLWENGQVGLSFYRERTVSDWLSFFFLNRSHHHSNSLKGFRESTQPVKMDMKDKE